MGLAPLLLAVAVGAQAATFVVDDAGDASDPTVNGVCDATGTAGCTLRAAIQEANGTAEADIIQFNIAPGGAVTISPGSALPTVTQPVTIDGTTQPGYAGTPIIELNGSGAGGGNALTLSGSASSGSTIQGLVINRFGGTALRILPGSSNNVIAGNYLGTDLTGTLARGNAVGVFIQGTGASPATNNRIGGAAASERNLISANTVDGVQIDGAGATGNLVQGNYIGLDANGSADLGNTNTGVAIFGGASNNVIGGTAAGAENVISGNNLYGVAFSQTGTTGNRVEGNLIGTNAAGTGAIGNSSHGVRILNSSTGNTIGGTASGAGNVISGNLGDGIRLDTSSNQVAGNYLGLDVTGTAAVPNGGDGIIINASGNTVGGTTASARNVISGNTDDGLEVTGAASTGNVVQGNYVGLDAAGTAAIPNGNDGIAIWQAQNNTFGGLVAGAGNVVSGNASGFYFGDATATGNSILGNFVGTNAAGTAALGNVTGIFLDAAGTAVRGNVISGNSWAGLWIRGANGTIVEDNHIGTAADGTSALPNHFGVYLSGGANDNAIGGIGAGAPNRIAHNANDGIVLIDTAGAGNSILANEIHSNGGLGIDLDDDGVNANDASDADSGSNDRLNFPEVTSVQDSGGTLTAYFKLDVPAGSYRIEFFKNPSGTDASGNGEGEVFAGSVNVTHSGGGVENFNHSFAGAVGDAITATATVCTDAPVCTAFGSTSELGNAFTAVTTAVELVSFTATPHDRAVELEWQTGSELSNLGFHLYRSLSASGPYQRLTEQLIPGLGSSPAGARYAYRDTGLENGVRYFYQLQDIETTGRTALHGPVPATPQEGLDAPAGEDDPSEPRPGVAYGDPSKVSLRVIEQGPGGATLELVTGGFLAVPQPDGTVRLEVAHCEELDSPGLPALPVRRAWIDAVAGRGARIASIQAFDPVRFEGLRPAQAGRPEVVSSRSGVMRARSRKTPATRHGEGLFPSWSARLAETAFQEDRKKALVELAPLRWDGTTLHLARRLVVHLRFAGREANEEALRGAQGRRHRERASHFERNVLARLSVSAPGLYGIDLSEILRVSPPHSPARRPRALSADSLLLTRQGEPVPFHVEPSTGEIGPRSRLYFSSAGESSNPYGKTAVYELEWSSESRKLPVQSAAPEGGSVRSYLHREEREENRLYQAGLIDAPAPWFWDVLISPVRKSYSFRASSVVARPAKLSLWLWGASGSAAGPDHHVRVWVNETPVAEESWGGKMPKTIESDIAPEVLREGENELVIENLGGAGPPHSMVLLDRFSLTYARQTVAQDGVLEAFVEESGAMSVAGLTAGALVVRTSPEPAWLEGVRVTPAGISFQAEAGGSYLAVAPEAVLAPEIRMASPTGLRATSHRADYLVVGPRELLAEAGPLLALRRDQGLAARAVPIEDVYDEFGYGEARPEALESFLEYAYHHWQPPSVRYVVLLGDATYDPKDYLRTGVSNRVPPLTIRTRYMWTASDPAYAAVNGEDALPDLALGRLPAADVEEARRLIGKLVAYERSGQDLSGPVVIVADDPDEAGDFERDGDAIAARLSDRAVEKIYLGALGREATRTRIVSAFERGTPLLSYVGHGGIGLWASENVFDNALAARLQPHERQPIVMTMNCLNGYFHFPYFDALAEALVKGEGRGAIAAFSPSGLSVNGPAHVYHQAVIDELTSGRHGRLGDAVLAAQRVYVESGAFPELVAIYHLFGDPALTLR